MKYRHLEVQPDVPIEDLPAAAIVDILERGDLADWKPVAEAIARDPKGQLAEKVMHLVDAYPMYGTSALWRAWIDRFRARFEGPWPSIPVENLAILRRRLGLTQSELAGRIGISQSDLSKLERRRDLRLSTLRTYAAALGCRLQIVFERDGKLVEIVLPNSRD